MRVIRLENKFALIPESEIVNGYLCDTFDSYGQKLDCDDAGCYSIESSTSDFRQDLLSYLAEILNDSNLINWEYEWDFEEELREYLKEKHGEKGIKLLDKFIEEETVHVEAVYTTWWDGSNWKSKIWNSDSGYSEGKLLDEDDPVAQAILAAWEKCGDGIGYIEKVSKSVFVLYEGLGYLFSGDRYPGWYIAKCEIIEPGQPITIETEEDGQKKIKAPYWIDNLWFFFEEKGEIYLGKGFFSPDGEEIYNISKTNSIEIY